VIQILCWLMPASRLKNRLLRMFGHDVHPSAHIGPNLVVGVSKFEIGQTAAIGPFNVFRGLGLVRLSEYSIVNSWNWISAHPIYRTVDPDAGTLFLGTCARIGSRNYLDSSGTIVIKAFSYVGGNKCLLQTHEPDFATDQQSVGRITIGHHSMVGSRAVLLKGAELPDESLLAANSTLVRASRARRKGLYAGSPAAWKRDTEGDWFSRNTYTMGGHIIDEPMGILRNDLDHDGVSVVVDQDALAELAGRHPAQDSRRRMQPPLNNDMTPPL
jgi:acetyltransferase-like isoleucine patch superfamily enzyme